MSRHARLWLVVTVLAAVVGAAYATAAGGTAFDGAVNGAVIGGALIGIEVFYIQRQAGAGLRRLRLPLYLGITTLLWLVVIGASLQAVGWLLSDAARDGEGSNFWRDLGFSLVAAVAFNSVVRLRSLVGPRVFTNFLFGRYHRPLREARIFMFLDLTDSTMLAERLGDEQVQMLIGQFFFDIAEPLVRHGGETHRYIGDEVVVTWPLSTPADNARCLLALADIARLMTSREAFYRRHFEVVPRYRTALHCGEVVAGEVGDDKREIVYFGDTVNTAARLSAQCKSVGEPLLVSDALLARMTVPPVATVRSLGAMRLRGKHEPIAVSAVDLAVAESGPGRVRASDGRTAL